MNILLLSVFIILWWIAIWGLIETLLSLYIKNSREKAILVYGSLSALLLAIAYSYPELAEHFV
jgi:hypothetical protein